MHGSDNKCVRNFDRKVWSRRWWEYVCIYTYIIL
jgi:hypothetical protein